MCRRVVVAPSRQLRAHAHCKGSRYSDLSRVELIAVVNEVGCLDLASSVRAPSLEPPSKFTPEHLNLSISWYYDSF
jgi:hypothetical protein